MGKMLYCIDEIWPAAEKGSRAINVHMQIRESESRADPAQD